MEKVTYNISFIDALQHVIDGGAVKGNSFKNGCFLRMNKYGQLVLVNCNDFYDSYEEVTFVSIKALSLQKYRELSVLTPKELSI